MNEDITLKEVKSLSDETQVGLLFCYKALKRYENDYQRAYDYLVSDEFKNSIHTIARVKDVKLSV